MKKENIKESIKEWKKKQINEEKWIKNGRLTKREFDNLIKELERVVDRIYKRDKVNIKNIFGEREQLKVKNVIVLPQFNFPKLFVLQEIEYPSHRRDDKDKTEVRIAYYIAGKRGNKKGKWTWGQYNPHIPKRDLKKLLKEAKERGIL